MARHGWSQSHSSGPAPRRAHAAAGGEGARPGKGSSRRQGDRPHRTAQTGQPDRGLASPDTDRRARGAGRDTQTHRLPLRAPGATPPPPMGWCHPSQTLTAAGPGGLLPAAAPVQARGRGTQSSRLLGDAGRGPAVGGAAGGGRCPRDGPPGWHEGHWKGAGVSGRRAAPGGTMSRRAAGCPRPIWPHPVAASPCRSAVPAFSGPAHLSVSQILTPPHNSYYSQSESPFP